MKDIVIKPIITNGVLDKERMLDWFEKQYADLYDEIGREHIAKNFYDVLSKHEKGGVKLVHFQSLSGSLHLKGIFKNHKGFDDKLNHFLSNEVNEGRLICYVTEYGKAYSRVVV